MSRGRKELLVLSAKLGKLGLTTKPNELGFILIKAEMVRRHPKVQHYGGLKESCDQ